MTPTIDLSLRSIALVRALGTGDEIEAAHILGTIDPRESLGMLVQTAQIVVTMQRSLPGDVDSLCDQLEAGVRR
ncbi:hypothetical protein KGD82_13835 [Nocardiopsis eucommiae]|uniref:Uncharacterized protein n=1 Tax=Nocardiopsis eucommiae TaxID=2831970 RepID=A0A975L698_9ACTN|nr:hypothetical protein KGD82_13835 [Nocardiopsis eucommiae]